MTQKELIDKIHSELHGRIPLIELIHRIAETIKQQGETNARTVFAMLEPASCAYIHAYPGDLLDGPWDI